MAIEANYNDGGLSSAAPYFNDWDETKKYLQMLFTPGRALQARELTQVQTMLQTQIDRFGSHIFENGSPVAGGQTTVNNNISYVRLNPDSAYNNITDYSTLVGTALTEFSTGVAARIVAVDATVTDDDPYPVLFIQYTSNSLDGTSEEFSAASELTTASIAASSSSSGGLQVSVITSGQASTLGESALGDAYLISIDRGIFFIDGFFVLVDKQSYAPRTTSGGGVRQFSATPTTRVGLSNTKTVVNIGEDSSLGDPANGAANFSAPGAARLKFDPVLTEKAFTENTSTIANLSDEDFVELIRLSSGVVKKRIKYPIYSELMETMARRTHDESGHYTVRPFRASVRESSKRRTLTIPSFSVGSSFTQGEYVSATTGSSSSSSGGATAIGIVASWDGSTDELVVDLVTGDEFVAGDFCVNDAGTAGGFVTGVTTEHFDVVLDPGKAYIFGYEFETISPEYVPIKRAKQVSTAAGDTVVCKYGSYLACDVLEGVFDINEQERITLYGTDAGSSSSSSDPIGEATVKHILYDTVDNYYRVYIYDVVINSGKSLGDTELLVGQQSNAYAYIDSVGGHQSGVTYLFRRSTHSTGNSIFALPSAPVQTDLTSVTYHYRLYQTGVTASSTTATFVMPNAGDLYYPFAGGTTSSNLRENYIVVNDTTGTDISDAVTQVNRTGDTLVITFSDASHNGDSISIIGVAQSSSVARSKTLVENYTIPADLAMNGSNEVPLGVADISSLASVLDAGNGDADVTSSFILDNGQRDNVYDYGKLKLAPGSSVTGPFTVTVNYFTHTGSGPLTYNSYSGIEYEDIPTYIGTSNGYAYRLRDSVDFRPIKDNQFVGTSSSSSSPDTIDYAKVICPSDDTYRTFTTTHAFYTPRIDKVILTRELEFEVIEGDGETIPADRNDAMTLYTVSVTPQTSDPSGVKLGYVDNRRYTMKDIGKLRTRISNLEYYTSLSLLEKEATQLTVKDVNGAERFKNGILVDSFNGHQIGQVSDRGYACSMDFVQGSLRPSFTAKNVSLDYNNGSSTGELRKGDQITLNPTSTTVPFVEQPLASQCISVNPFNLTSWLGDMTLTPDSDTWVDTTIRPKVLVNYEGSADAWQHINNSTSATGYGTEWNDWETVWAGEKFESSQSIKIGRVRTVNNSSMADWGSSGRSYGTGFNFDIIESGTTQSVKRQTRKGIKTSYDVDTVIETQNGKVVNVKIVPYMRAKTITAVATGLKPNTVLYPFFGDESVAQYCSPSTIQTDSAGAVTVTFNLPDSIFTSGSKLFRLIDNPNNLVADAISTAESVYTSKGSIEEREDTIVSTKRAIVKRTEVTDTRVVTGPVERFGKVIGNSTKSSYTAAKASLKERSSGVRKAAGWNDPIAQSFLVDPANFPNGIFLASVDLFFKTKDDNLPVTIDLRPSVNGYPSSSKLIPFSVVTKQPADVNTSDNPDPSNASSYTRFDFPSFIYLAPGEYHIVARSNSDKYCAYIAEIGQTQIGSSNRITEQPYAGSFFKSQNASTWTADQAADLTFRLNRCTFSTTTAAEVIMESESQSPDVNYDVCHIMTNNISFADAPISYSYAKTPNGDSLGAYTNIQPNNNIFQSTQHELIGTGDMTVKTRLSTNDPAISPIVDETRYAIMAIENIINNSTTGETESTANTTSGAKARYISRRVTMDTDFGATDLKVYLTANIPKQSEVDVYYKVLAGEDATPFDDIQWVKLNPVTGTLEKASGVGDVREYEFRSSATDINGDTTVVYGNYDEFQTYAIKIVMRSTNTSVVPTIDDMRAIAVL